MRRPILPVLFLLLSICNACIFAEDDPPNQNNTPQQDMAKDVAQDVSNDQDTGDMGPADVSVDLVNPEDMAEDEGEDITQPACMASPDEGLLCCVPDQIEAIDTNTNVQHCGSCDRACDPNQQCEQGVCVCPAGASAKPIQATLTARTKLLMRPYFGSSRNLCVQNPNMLKCAIKPYVIDPDPTKLAHVVALYEPQDKEIRTISLDGHGNVMGDSVLTFQLSSKVIEHVDMLPVRDGMIVQVVFKESRTSPAKYDIVAYYIKPDDQNTFQRATYSNGATGLSFQEYQVDSTDQEVMAFASALSSDARGNIRFGSARIENVQGTKQIVGRIVSQNSEIALEPYKIDLGTTTPSLGIKYAQVGVMDQRVVASWWNGGQFKAVQWKAVSSNPMADIDAPITGEMIKLGDSTPPQRGIPMPLMQPLGYSKMLDGWVFQGTAYTEAGVAGTTSALGITGWNPSTNTITSAPVAAKKLIMGDLALPVVDESSTQHTWLENSRAIALSGQPHALMTTNGIKTWGPTPISANTNYTQWRGAKTFEGSNSYIGLFNNGAQVSLHFYQVDERGPVCTLPPSQTP